MEKTKDINSNLTNNETRLKTFVDNVKIIICNTIN